MQFSFGTQGSEQGFPAKHRGRFPASSHVATGPPLAWIEDIAHDVQNLLSSIISITECAEADIQDGDTVALEAVIPSIATLASSAAEILGELLRASENDGTAVVQVSLKEIVEGMMGLLRIEVPGNITLRTDLAAGDSLITANVTQMRRVILNLVVNAAEAIGSTPGTIRIVASKVTDPETGWGEFVRLEVSDTGSGIPEAARSRVFERSHSSKGAGHGLGLALVRSLVRAHGGTIKLAAGMFTTFQVILPCCKAGTFRKSPGSQTS